MDNIDKILDDIIAEFGSEAEDIELITRSSRRENHDLPEALRQNSSHNSRKQGDFQNKRTHISSEKKQRTDGSPSLKMISFLFRIRTGKQHRNPRRMYLMRNLGSNPVSSVC